MNDTTWESFKKALPQAKARADAQAKAGRDWSRLRGYSEDVYQSCKAEGKILSELVDSLHYNEWFKPGSCEHRYLINMLSDGHAAAWRSQQ